MHHRQPQVVAAQLRRPAIMPCVPVKLQVLHRVRVEWWRPRRRRVSGQAEFGAAHVEARDNSTPRAVVDNALRKFHCASEPQRPKVAIVRSARRCDAWHADATRHGTHPPQPSQVAPSIASTGFAAACAASLWIGFVATWRGNAARRRSRRSFCSVCDGEVNEKTAQGHLVQ